MNHSRTVKLASPVYQCLNHGTSELNTISTFKRVTTEAPTLFRDLHWTPEGPGSLFSRLVLNLTRFTFGTWSRLCSYLRNGPGSLVPRKIHRARTRHVSCSIFHGHKSRVSPALERRSCGVRSSCRDQEEVHVQKHRHDLRNGRTARPGSSGARTAVRMGGGSMSNVFGVGLEGSNTF